MSKNSSPELVSGYECPVACFQQVMSGKYKLRILWDLREGPLRYGELRKSLALGIPSGKAIAPRVLSRELKVLTNLGWIERKEYAVVVPCTNGESPTWSAKPPQPQTHHEGGLVLHVTLCQGLEVPRLLSPLVCSRCSEKCPVGTTRCLS